MATKSWIRKTAEGIFRIIMVKEKRSISNGGLFTKTGYMIRKKNSLTTQASSEAFILLKTSFGPI